jgi:hypothetical protein
MVWYGGAEANELHMVRLKSGSEQETTLVAAAMK